jgi:transposase-like protein
MINKVDKIEQIRRAYHVEGKSMREIAQEFHHSRHTLKKIIDQAEASHYTLKDPREAPVLGPYKARLQELLAENERLPGKHRLTGQRMFQLLRAEGYGGSAASVQTYLWQQRRAQRQVQVFIPLEFEPGHAEAWTSGLGRGHGQIGGAAGDGAISGGAAELFAQGVCNGFSEPETGVLFRRARSRLSSFWRCAPALKLR